MKNEVRMNVYVWADISVCTSRVGSGRGARAGGKRYRWSLAPPATSPPQRPTRRKAIDRLRLHSAAMPLYILTGVPNTRADPSSTPYKCYVKLLGLHQI